MPDFNKTQALLEDIEAYRGEFCANAVIEFENLCAARGALETTGPNAVSEDAMFEIQRRAHKLAGRGGTFGYEHLSVSARALELEMDRITRSAQPMRASDVTTVGAMIDAVGAAVKSMVVTAAT